MANLWRLRVGWSGAGVTGPGVSTFYFTSSMVGGSDDVLAFFASAPLLYPSNVTITVPSFGDVLDDTTGTLIGTWSEPGTGGTQTGTNTGDYAQGVGAQVRWQTNGIVNGRRVVGSTFLVPIAGAIFDTNGSLDNATVTSMTTAANALISAAPTLRVWSRPAPGRAGSSHAIVAASVPDRPSWLRSRRT